MENANLLIAAMAEKCRAVLTGSEAPDSGLPQAVHPRHLLWMCDQIEQHAEDWPDTKLHRWIGFVQCGVMANRLLDFQEIKAMFGEAKQAYGDGLADQNLVDHLDPTSSFRMDVGGEG